MPSPKRTLQEEIEIREKDIALKLKKLKELKESATKKERAERTHYLCTVAGDFEKLFSTKNRDEAVFVMHFILRDETRRTALRHALEKFRTAPAPIPENELVRLTKPEENNN